MAGRSVSPDAARRGEASQRDEIEVRGPAGIAHEGRAQVAAEVVLGEIGHRARDARGRGEHVDADAGAVAGTDRKVDHPRVRDSLEDLFSRERIVHLQAHAVGNRGLEDDRRCRFRELALHGAVVAPGVERREIGRAVEGEMRDHFNRAHEVRIGPDLGDLETTECEVDARVVARRDQRRVPFGPAHLARGEVPALPARGVIEEAAATRQVAHREPVRQGRGRRLGAGFRDRARGLREAGGTRAARARLKRRPARGRGRADRTHTRQECSAIHACSRNRSCARLTCAGGRRPAERCRS